MASTIQEKTGCLNKKKNIKRPRFEDNFKKIKNIILTRPCMSTTRTFREKEIIKNDYLVRFKTALNYETMHGIIDTSFKAL